MKPVDNFENPDIRGLIAKLTETVHDGVENQSVEFHDYEIVFGQFEGCELGHLAQAIFAHEILMCMESDDLHFTAPSALIESMLVMYESGIAEMKMEIRRRRNMWRGTPNSYSGMVRESGNSSGESTAHLN